MFKCLKVTADYTPRSSGTQGWSYKVIRKRFRQMIIRRAQIKLSWVNFKAFVGCLVWPSPFAAHLRLPQRCGSAVPPTQNKSLVKNIKDRNNHSKKKKKPKTSYYLIRQFTDQAAFRQQTEGVLRSCSKWKADDRQKGRQEGGGAGTKQVGCGQVTLL